MKLALASTLTLTIVLTGCSIPTAPTAVSSLNGIFTEPVGRSGATLINNGSQVSLGIVYSQNTQTNRAYLRDYQACLLYTSPSPRDGLLSRMPSPA